MQIAILALTAFSGAFARPYVHDGAQARVHSDTPRDAEDEACAALKSCTTCSADKRCHFDGKDCKKGTGEACTEAAGNLVSCSTCKTEGYWTENANAKGKGVCSTEAECKAVQAVKGKCYASPEECGSEGTDGAAPLYIAAAASVAVLGALVY